MSATQSVNMPNMFSQAVGRSRLSVADVSSGRSLFVAVGLIDSSVLVVRDVGLVFTALVVSSPLLVALPEHRADAAQRG